jgi:hypothetical protein
MSKNANNDEIEQILKMVGPRVQPDEEVRQQVFDEVHKAWLQQNTTPFYLNHWYQLAASVLVFISIFSFGIHSNNPADYNMAKSIQIYGQIETSQDQKNWSFLDTNKTIHPGDYIRTQNNNRIMIELDNGNSFRVDENTQLQLVNRNEIHLSQGQIYVESAQQQPTSKLLIKTDIAEVNHIGTRYLVSLLKDKLNVAVREGKVVINNKEVTNQVEHGFEASIDTTGNYQHHPISSHDKKWGWTQKIAKSFNIQDKTVAEYLQWVSNETGYEILWQSTSNKVDANKVKLSGSINGVLPIESLDVIMPTTRFNYQIRGSVIHISE